LCFDTSGACVLNPHGNGAIPKAARVKSYPVRERYGMVWIWMGDHQLVDDKKIPAFTQFGDPERFVSVCGALYVKANYQLITDNLLDLTHGQYIHPIFANANGQPIEMLPSAPEEDTVWAKYRRRSAYANSYFQTLGFPKDELADTHNEMRWNPPALLLLDVGITAAGTGRDNGFSVPTAHLLTPETETTTHYFWGMARNFRMDDAALSDWLLKAGTNTFTNEDTPVIEAQQRAMGTETDLLKCNPVLLTTDGPSVRARRLLAEMIRVERNGADTRPAEVA
jgi:vanillate O-demethylase monooxygenase subunit